MVALGLVRALRSRGIVVQTFKKGPDFVDPAWLKQASGCPSRNLDVRMCGKDAVLSTFAQHAPRDGVSVIEGNRGLFDGCDALGTYSTARLAQLLASPTLLVVSAAKATRTVAATVLGCMHLEPNTPLTGVILNHLAGERHCRITRKAVEDATGLPVVGALPRSSEPHILFGPMGLQTPAEHPAADEALGKIERWVTESVDVDGVLAMARAAPGMESGPATVRCSEMGDCGGAPPRIGVPMDSAFSFYYPENIEALESMGATIVAVSPTHDRRLPLLDALYVGGGFVERHAEALSSNDSMRGEIRAAVERGLPVYAEAGGLAYLSRSVCVRDRTWPMVGALPIEVSVEERSIGHGYVEADVVCDTPFYRKGERLVGHRLHSVRVIAGLERVECVARVKGGRGLDGAGVDGLVFKRVFATTMHVHALGMASWATGMVRAAIASRET